MSGKAAKGQIKAGKDQFHSIFEVESKRPICPHLSWHNFTQQTRKAD